MKHSALPLTKKLIKLQSYPGNDKALEKCLDLVLAELQDFTIERFENNGVRSALVYAGPKRPKQFKVIFNAHLDVIPGKDFQYIPQVEGDRLLGVGALDMKANVVCMLTVFKELAKTLSYPIALQLTTDEEVGGFHGTKYQIEQGVRTEFAIAGETTQFNIVHKTKGILWAKVAAQGVAAHSAYPWDGKNAVWEIHEFLSKIKKRFPLPKKKEWVTTVNVSSISSSNKAFNKVPDDCEVCLDIRFVPEDEKTILETIKAMLPEGLRIEVLANEPSQFVKEHDSFVQALKASTEEVLGKSTQLCGAQGSSDVRHYKAVGGHGVEFGPIGDGIGSDNEWISIESLDNYMQILKSFLLSLDESKKRRV